ncbi:MAG TPA: glycosyltransferase family 2 protein [Anaerolineales bacterium]|nr:glycosyltransferase family 2 protein [Anaerolineales bacterium]
MPPALSIVIVTYNSATVIRDCLASIPGGWDVGQDSILAYVETIVVDNGSTDSTPDLIRREFPWVKLLAHHGNLLFAGGNNYGFQHAAAPLIFMLNPDTVVHPGALRALVDFADAHLEAGMIAPHVVNPDGSLQHNTFRFPNLSMAFYGFFERLAPLDSPQNGRYLPEDYTHVHEVEHVLGATLLFRRELYNQLPGMDEKFGIYFEETDWCYRARRAGWKLLYTPDATLTHLGAHSTSRNPEKSSAQFYKSQSYFYRKNYGLFKYAALKTVTAVGLLYWLARTLKGWLTKQIDGEKLRRRLWSYGEILKA